MEVMMVIAIVGVLAALALPLLRDHDSLAVRMAGEQMLADIAVAQQESIAHSSDRRMLVVHSDGTGYYLSAQSAADTPIIHPIGQVPYRITFGQGSAGSLASVRVSSYSLSGDNRLIFGPYGELDQTDIATLTLSSGQRSLTITIDPTSGQASVGTLN